MSTRGVGRGSQRFQRCELGGVVGYPGLQQPWAGIGERLRRYREPKARHRIARTASPAPHRAHRIARIASPAPHRFEAYAVARSAIRCEAYAVERSAIRCEAYAVERSAIRCEAYAVERSAIRFEAR